MGNGWAALELELVLELELELELVLVREQLWTMSMSRAEQWLVASQWATYLPGCCAMLTRHLAACSRRQQLVVVVSSHDTHGSQH